MSEVLTEREERTLRIAATYAEGLPAGASFSGAEVQAMLERFYNRSTAEAESVVAGMAAARRAEGNVLVSAREAAENELGALLAEEYRLYDPAGGAASVAAAADPALRGGPVPRPPVAGEVTVRELEVTLECVLRDLDREGSTAGLPNQIVDMLTVTTEALGRAIKALRAERFGPEEGVAVEETVMASAALFMDWLRLGGAKDALREVLLDALGDDSYLDKLVRTVRDGVEAR